LAASRAADPDGSVSTHEAAKHFQRGVALYGETDYRAALVEFKRAYSIAPNAAVLYNVGETEFQLQDYAAALTTLQQYLAESSPTDSHRAEVESSVEVLRARVGHVTVTTSPAGADVAIDDQAVGKTPLDRPVLVSIGHRKVIASMPGRPPVTRYVDVAADDNVAVTLQLAAPADTTGAPSRSTIAHDPESTSGAGATWRAIGWIGTGILGAGAVTFAVLGDQESKTLESARASYPVASATLTQEARLTTTYAVLADSLAGAAVVLGGVTLISMLTSHDAGPRVRGGAPGVQVGVGPGSARLEVTF
jgi:tetratricopeptide (TPR) repeat protein